MSIIDLTHSLSGPLSVFPGHPKFICRPVATLGTDPYNVHSIAMGTHTGTHIDTPYHFFENGLTVEQLDLDMLVAPAVVVDVRGKKAREKITWETDIARYAPRLKTGVILLFCTGWSKYWGQPTYSDYPYLDSQAARELINMGIKVIGSDTLSPDEFPLHEGDEACFDVHRMILGAGGIIAENLTNLEALLELGSEAPMVSLLPLKLEGCDGSPIRAVAWPAGRDSTRIDSN